MVENDNKADEKFKTPPDAPTLPSGGGQLGRYRIVRVLGQGGMGQVFFAEDVELERSVALKVIHPHLVNNPDVIARFRQEARAAARLNHPGIVQIYEFGQDEAGIPFFAMEYIEGRSLQDFLRERGQLKIEEALRISLSLVKALEYAHVHHVIHRDIKPANILISKEGRIKILDFGLARCLEADSSLTQSGTIIGSPHYMSPEQGKGEKADHRSDIYSLGVTLYHMLTGSVPFDADSPVAVMLHHVQSPLPRSEVLSAMLDGRIEALLQRMMAKKPEERFSDYSELRQTLQQFLQLQQGDSVTVASPPPPPSPPPVPPQEAVSSLPPMLAPAFSDSSSSASATPPFIIQHKRSWVWPLLTGMLLTLLILIVLGNRKRGESRQPGTKGPDRHLSQSPANDSMSQIDPLADRFPRREEMIEEITEDIVQATQGQISGMERDIAEAVVMLDFSAARDLLRNAATRIASMPASAEKSDAEKALSALAMRLRDIPEMQNRAGRKLSSLQRPVRIYNPLTQSLMDLAGCSETELMAKTEKGEAAVPWAQVHPSVLLCLGAWAYMPAPTEVDKEHLLNLAALYRMDMGELSQAMIFPAVDFAIYLEGQSSVPQNTPLLEQKLHEHILEKLGPMGKEVAGEIASRTATMDFEGAARISREELGRKASLATTPEATKYVRSLRDLATGLDSMQDIKRDIILYVKQQEAPVILLNMQQRGRMVVEGADQDGLQVRSANGEKTILWADAGPTLLVRMALKAYGRNPDAQQKERLRMIEEMFNLQNQAVPDLLRRNTQQKAIPSERLERLKRTGDNAQ